MTNASVTKEEIRKDPKAKPTILSMKLARMAAMKPSPMPRQRPANTADIEDMWDNMPV